MGRSCLRFKDICKRDVTLARRLQGAVGLQMVAERRQAEGDSSILF